MILPADHPERIHAVIPVTDVVMILVRLVLLKTIQEQRRLIPNAVQPANAVKGVRPEQAHHITEHFLRLPNVGLVTNAAIPAVPVLQVQAAEVDMNLTAAVRLNAEAPVTPAANILTPTLARVDINLLHADQATQLPAPDQNLVLAVQLPVLVINARKILPATAIMITTITTPVAEIPEITIITIITPIQEQPRLRMILMNVKESIKPDRLHLSDGVTGVVLQVGQNVFGALILMHAKLMVVPQRA